MYQTFNDLREKGLTYASAEDISRGIHFIERMTKLQTQAKKFGVDLTKFRAKDINKFNTVEYGSFIDGSTLMALVRRGFLSKVSQETERIEIPANVFEFKHKETGKVERTWWDTEKFRNDNYEDITEMMSVDSSFNIYALNQNQIDLTKDLVIQAIQAL